MTFKKTLTNIALIGTLTLMELGCSNSYKFNYNGEINEEEVWFNSKPLLTKRNLQLLSCSLL